MKEYSSGKWKLVIGNCRSCNHLPITSYRLPVTSYQLPINLDIVIEWLLVGLLAFMPLAFGVVHAWSEEVVTVISGAIVICFLIKLVCHRDQNIIWTWAYVPLGLFLLIPIIQLTPLPATLLRIISANTVALKTELLGDLPNAETLLNSMTLSFYPNATKHDLRLVLAVAAVFVVVLNVFRRPDQIKRLLVAMTLIGGTIALITLGQNLFGNGKIYWFVPTRYGAGFSGPFVNHSNYGQFMNLSIGAALALVLVRLHEDFEGSKITPAAISEYLNSGKARQLWLFVALISLCAASVFVSLTRGGIVSMLIAITVTSLLLAWRKSLKGHSWLMAVTGLIAFTLILYIGFDAVYDRLSSLRDFHEAQSGRVQILKDIAVIFTKFPALGTGLGTHLVVYPMFDRSMKTSLAAHAENEYAQVLEETGIIGLVCLIILGIIILSSYARSIRSTKIPICSAAYGLGFGILAILIHSLSDFGQHLPANATLSAISCALMLRAAQPQPLNGPGIVERLRDSRFGLFLTCALLICALVIWAWAVISANNARIAEAHWQKALTIERNLISKNWQGTKAEYADLISHASSAADYQPDNIEYRHRLNVYRWRLISRTTDLNTAPAPVFRQEDAGVVSEDLMLAVCDIVDKFHKGRLLCPTYGPTYSRVGRIEKFVLGDESGAEKIRKAFRLAPCNPRICFLAAYVDFLEGRYEDCIEKFNRAIQLDGGLFTDVVNIYINHLSRPHLAISAAADDIGRLSYVANLLEDMEYTDLAEQTRQRVRDLLVTRCSQPGAPASAFISLADVYRKQQDNDAAIECYRHALAIDYNQVGWRLELARLLMEMGNIQEAIRQAKICLQLRPESKAAQKLVAELSVHPATFADEKMVR